MEWLASHLQVLWDIWDIINDMEIIPKMFICKLGVLGVILLIHESISTMYILLFFSDKSQYLSVW